MKATNLSPCPYCGGAASRLPFQEVQEAPFEARVGCSNCNAVMLGFGTTQEDAWADAEYSWNKRAAPEKEQIRKIAKVVRDLTYNLRTNMTSITRYVRHKRSKDVPEPIYEARHINYMVLADAAVDNILKCINENKALRELEIMSIEEAHEKASASHLKGSGEK